MEEGALSSYVSQARSALAEAPEMSARTAELRLTQPLLEVLGWDLHGSDVTAGVDVDGDRIDFGLGIEGDLVVLVDTVAPEAGIDEADVRTLATGMRRRSVERGLLVDGRAYLFLTDVGERFDHDRYDLGALPDAEDAIRPFTRAASAERAGPDPATYREAAVALDGDREVLVEEVSTRLTAATDADAAAVERTVRAETVAFLDGLVETLAARGEQETAGPDESGDGPTGESDGEPASESDGEAGDASGEAATGGSNDGAAGATGTADEGGSDGSTVPDVAAATAEPADGATTANGGSAQTSGGDPAEAGDADEASAGEADDAPDGPADPTPGVRDRTPDEAGGETDTEEYVVRFFDGSTTVGAVGGATPHAALRQGVEYLEDGHSLVSRLSPPWRPEDAPGIAVVNDSPEHPDGTPWHDYVELSTGDYLLTGVEPEGCREILEGLAGGAGLRVMFQGDW